MGRGQEVALQEKQIVNLHSRVVPGLEPVTLGSSDKEIFKAINIAGAYIASTKPRHREWDWRESEGGKHQVMKVYWYAFVHWHDVSDDPSIIPRLTKMVRKGVLRGSLQAGIATHMTVPRQETLYR